MINILKFIIRKMKILFCALIFYINIRYFLSVSDMIFCYHVMILSGDVMIRIMLSKVLGDKRWTQADLARKTGIRANTINDLYHEMSDRISLEQLDLICEALDIDLFDLIERTPNEIPLIENTRTGKKIKRNSI